MSNRERMKTKAIEIFLLFLFVIIDIAILCLSCIFEKPKEILFISEVGNYREMYCNTDIHIVSTICLDIRTAIY